MSSCSAPRELVAGRRLGSGARAIYDEPLDGEPCVLVTRDRRARRRLRTLLDDARKKEDKKRLREQTPCLRTAFLCPIRCPWLGWAKNVSSWASTSLGATRRPGGSARRPLRRGRRRPGSAGACAGSCRLPPSSPPAINRACIGTGVDGRSRPRRRGGGGLFSGARARGLIQTNSP